MPRPALPSGKEMWERSAPVKKFVMWCLNYRPGTRGSERLLIYYVWRYYDGVDIQNGLTIKKMLKLTSPETIRRRRAEIQNSTNDDGSWKHPELRATERTHKKRRARESAIHNYFGSGYGLADYEPIGVVEG